MVSEGMFSNCLILEHCLRAVLNLELPVRTELWLTDLRFFGIILLSR